VDRLSLFSTEILVFRLPGVQSLAQSLAALLVDERCTRPSWDVANVGGWHSPPDLSQRPDPFPAVMQLVVDHVGLALRSWCEEAGRPVPRFRYGVQAWSTVMEQGDYTILHDHGDAAFSAVFYADAGDAPDSAHLAFVDPRRATSRVAGLELWPSTFTVRPETGMLVLFPGALQHYVHPYRGSRPRVCLSANVSVEQVGPDARAR